jgi:hypothetical protein
MCDGPWHVPRAGQGSGHQPESEGSRRGKVSPKPAWLASCLLKAALVAVAPPKSSGNITLIITAAEESNGQYCCSQVEPSALHWVPSASHSLHLLRVKLQLPCRPEPGTQERVERNR